MNENLSHTNKLINTIEHRRKSLLGELISLRYLITRILAAIGIKNLAKKIYFKLKT